MDFSFGDGQMQTDNNNGAGNVNNTKNNVTNITLYRNKNNNIFCCGRTSKV